MATPEPRHGARRTISIVDDVNLLSPQTRTNLPLPLGPLTASVLRGLEGEVESSCSHPREAMNLFLARRISRRNRTASLFQHAVSTHLGHKRRWLSARCISRKVSLVFLSSPPKEEEEEGRGSFWSGATVLSSEIRYPSFSIIS